MTSDDTDTTTESKATSLLVSFIVDGSVGVALFLLFCVLRPRVPHVFDARREARKLRLDTKSAEAPPVPPGLFAWVPHVLSFSDEAIYNLAGMDALMQVTFFRFARRLFTACTIVGLAVLMPINWFAGDKLSGISRTTMSNIPADSGALWAHLLCAYAITAYMFYELRKLHLKYREYRERTLHAQILSARTVLLQGVPATATTASIVEAFRPVLPDVATALRVWDLTDVADLLEQREEALTRLERARYNANLPQLPWSYRFQRIVMSMCGLTDNIKQPLLSSRQPAMLRGWRLFASPQQEAEYWAAVIEMVDERVISTREAALARAALPAAFVTFATSRSASIAAQCNLSSIPAGWLSKPAPEPRDVIWHNLGINPVHRRLKEFVSFAAVVGLFVLYSVLLTFAATAAEINSLSDKLLFLDVFTPDPWLRVWLLMCLTSGLHRGCILFGLCPHHHGAAANLLVLAGDVGGACVPHVCAAEAAIRDVSLLYHRSVLRHHRRGRDLQCNRANHRRPILDRHAAEPRRAADGRVLLLVRPAARPRGVHGRSRPPLAAHLDPHCALAVRPHSAGNQGGQAAQKLQLCGPAGKRALRRDGRPAVFVGQPRRPARRAVILPPWRAGLSLSPHVCLGAGRRVLRAALAARAHTSGRQRDYLPPCADGDLRAEAGHGQRDPRSAAAGPSRVRAPVLHALLP
eukprot:m.78968 g.78968  ORF g.78968 m.78968 type:complete len:693 (-) comp7988_c0_seq2:2357-4435(-)